MNPTAKSEVYKIKLQSDMEIVAFFVKALCQVLGYDSLNHAPLLDIGLFLCWVSNIAVFGHDK